MADVLRPDASAAIEFLRNLAPQGPWTLTAIPSDWPQVPAKWPRNRTSGEPYRTMTQTVRDIVKIAGWIDRCAQQQLNLYYTPNPLSRAVRSKPKKTDIAAVAWLYCDIDPRPTDVSATEIDKTRYLAEEQKRILAELANFDPAPTVVVFSGGGFQALWRASESHPINGDKNEAAEAERWNRALQVRFIGSDNTHNVDRLLRLPGSINWPDSRKRAKGRRPALARVIDELTDWSKSIELEAMPKAEPQTSAKLDAGADSRSSSFMLQMF